MNDMEQFMADVFGNGGVKRILDILDEKGQHPPYTKTVRLQNGEVQYFGVLREPSLAKLFAKEPQKVKIKFPQKAYIREVLSGSDYGLTDEVTTLLAANTVQIYSVIPHKVTAIKVNLGRKSFARGEIVPPTVTLQASGKLGNHTLRMNVLDPSGKEAECYSRNLSARDGKVAASFPLALNDKKGTWRVLVTDLTSGKEAKAAFTIQ
jgi:hypothetical protein